MDYFNDESGLKEKEANVDPNIMPNKNDVSVEHLKKNSDLASKADKIYSAKSRLAIMI